LGAERVMQQGAGERVGFQAPGCHAPGRVPAMRWWGWGDPARPPALGPRALELVRERVGATGGPRAPVALAGVRIEPAALAQGARVALRALLGEDGVREDHAERVTHAAGKGYPDLVRLRAGEPEGAPDAVLYPTRAEHLRAVLELCERHSLAVVAFGGGTSVVGGVAPLRGEHAGVVCLDMRCLGELVGLDRVSRIVTVQAGMRAPALERRLAREGFTLGHFPQSFEYVSLGGCAATRSAGQASTGYGRFEELVVGLRMSAPAGEIALAARPASAAGPDLRELLVGSEGTLGVIGELALRVRAAPAERRYEGVFFEDFAAGTDALRALAQEHAAPTLARLSDEEETRMSLAQAGADAGGRRALEGRVGRVYLRARGYGSGCMAILGFEGEPLEVERRRERALELVRGHGGLAVGRSPGEAWLKQRFAGPYLRDELLTHGVMVETLETATTWSGLPRLYRETTRVIADALNAQGTPGVVMCHVSHLYETGASLYFTLLAAQREGAEIEQWQAVKRAASEAIVRHGGTITHHHAVGRDHAPWIAGEVAELGVGALRALKAELDPAGIMNPGKLLP
jgi:alkyldihydroxyacetonephosphate synthase